MSEESVRQKVVRVPRRILTPDSQFRYAVICNFVVVSH